MPKRGCFTVSQSLKLSFGGLGGDLGRRASNARPNDRAWRQPGSLQSEKAEQAFGVLRSDVNFGHLKRLGRPSRPFSNRVERASFAVVAGSGSVLNIAGCGPGRRSWAESAPPEVVSARTGFRVIAVVPRRARRTLHRNVGKVLKSATHFALTSIVQARRMSRRCPREANGSSSAVGSLLAPSPPFGASTRAINGPHHIAVPRRAQPCNQGRDRGAARF